MFENKILEVHETNSLCPTKGKGKDIPVTGREGP
jgi:hypothetical protein